MAAPTEGEKDVPTARAQAPAANPLPPTPWSWRLFLALSLLVVAGTAYLMRHDIGVRGQALAGVYCFFVLVATFSTNLRAVNWRTILWGVGLQVLLAVLVLKVQGVYQGFEHAAEGVTHVINYSDEGAKFVFGNLADKRPPDKGGTWIGLFKPGQWMPQLAVMILPTILFCAALFTLLFHYGVLQWCVRIMAKAMVYLMGTSGAETLSVSANVFMGMTEAPLLVKPYVPRMTQSELFTLMVSGFAHISGGMMVIYISYGANPVAVLTTCVMACPCSLYLAKLFLPETRIPETSGKAHVIAEKSPYVNGIDALASGTTDGLRLALNVIAMLIVFVALVAMINGMLMGIKPALVWLGANPEMLPARLDDLSLGKIFGVLFSPAAFLMGVEPNDVDKVGTLLGTKLSLNEHVAFLEMKGWMERPDYMSQRSYRLAAFALTGFANFASIGIQLGGIGGMAPDRRHDLARLGGRALFVGFVATLLNAAIAGVLLE